MYAAKVTTCRNKVRSQSQHAAVEALLYPSVSSRRLTTEAVTSQSSHPVFFSIVILTHNLSPTRINAMPIPVLNSPTNSGPRFAETLVSMMKGSLFRANRGNPTRVGKRDFGRWHLTKYHREASCWLLSPLCKGHSSPELCHNLRGMFQKTRIPKG